jgi:hypothetical protein
MKTKITILCAFAAMNILANPGVGSPVSIQGYTVTLPVSGTFTPSGPLTCNQGTAGPAWPVTGTFFQATQPVSGSVSVSNFPATQPVSGSVSVSNFPATQAVTGTFFQATQPVSGSVSVSNFPATQAVTGTFFQATQPVSGTFFPATQNVAGDVASGSADSGNPVKQGGVARTTDPTAVTNGQRVNGIFSILGKQVMVHEGVRERKVTGLLTLTANTEQTLIAAGAAGVFHDLILITATSSDTTQVIRLDFRASTGGAIVFSIHLQPGSGPNALVIPFPSSFPQTTAANNWTVQASVAPVGGQSVRVMGLAVDN